jgi:hypothetical protein
MLHVLTSDPIFRSKEPNKEEITKREFAKPKKDHCPLYPERRDTWLLISGKYFPPLKKMKSLKNSNIPSLNHIIFHESILFRRVFFKMKSAKEHALWLKKRWNHIP